ncbi:MAG TPA: clostripain-related cysteine peptidase [bacterium]|nr:clostripain-related cysteine peptidase [bacterium]
MKRSRFVYGFVISLLYILFLSSSIFGAGKKWTVMVYFAADNNIEGSAITDFLEMSEVGSDNNINLLVQLDRRSGYDTRYGDWTICHRFYVTAGMLPYESSAITDWGDGKGGREVNTGAPETLADFIRWGVYNYPADRYAVILWNHGGGWKTIEEEGKPLLPFKEVCWDDTSGDVLSTKNVRQAFEDSGQYIDIIGFDACLMGMLEVASELKSLGNVMVASEQTEPLSGWNFSGSLADLKSNPLMSPSQLGESIVENYIGHGGNGETLSAVDLTKIGFFNQSLDSLVEELISRDNEWLNVYIARQSTQNFDEAFFLDIYDFLYNLSISTSNGVILSLVHEAMDAFSSLVIASYAADGYRACGLSVYFPPFGGAIDVSYNGNVILFAEETLWKDFLEAFVSSDIFSGFTHVYGETFASGLPSGWSVIDGYNDGKTWAVKNTSPRSWVSSPYLNTSYMMVDSDAAGHVNMDEQLISPYFDFTGYTTVYLKFNHLFWYYTDEKADVDIRVGGGSWQNLRRYQGSNSEGSVFADITSIAAGKDNVQVRWHYYNANYDWFWAIDNLEFLVTVAEPLGAGDIDSSGVIDISDVIICLRMAVGLEITAGSTVYQHPYTPELNELADINSDGTVDISDVILVLRLSVGLDT